MKRSAHTALELIELATLLRQHAKKTGLSQYKDEMHAAIAEIEDRARMIAEEQRTSIDGPADPYARINMTI